MREKLQKKAITDISEKYYNDKNIFLAEYGTGSGKTNILLNSAFKILSRHKKSVIIATANNALVYDMKERVKKYGLNDDAVEIIIGANNYLDVRAAQDEQLHRHFKLDTDEILNWLEENPRPLLQNFLNDFNINDALANVFALNSDAMPKEEKRRLGFDLDSTIDSITSKPKVYITNHAYLITMYRFCKNESLYKLPVLIDEVHNLTSAASALFSNKFSAFALRKSIQSLLNSDLKIPKSNSKEMIKFSSQLKTIAAKISKTGDDKKAAVEELQALYRKDEKKKKAKSPIEEMRRITTALKKKQEPSSLKALYDIQRELTELTISINPVNFSKMVLSFSPTRKYPVLEVASENPAHLLRSHMFEKSRSYICGVSGTLKIAESDSIAENKWSIERLGFIDYFKKTDFEERHLLFRERVKSHIIFKVEDSIFKRDQGVYFINDDKSLLYPKHKDKDNVQAEISKWLDNQTQAILEALHGNMLILSSSFDNCIGLQERLIEEQKKDSRLSEYTILNSGGKDSRTTLQAKHKDIIDGGGKSILIGDTTFWTGVDLPGSYIDALVVSKLPFEPNATMFSSFRYGSFSSHYNNKMKAIVVFRQGLGRGIRSNEDNCAFLILDPRIKDNKNKMFLYFLDKIAKPLKG